MPSPLSEPEPEQTFVLPQYPARMVSEDLFAPVRCRRGVDPQSLPRLVLPCVYVLRCTTSTGPLFYVGVSSDVVSRIGQHFAGCGASLTRKFRPTHVEQIIYHGDKDIETDVVLFFARHLGGGGNFEHFGPKIRGGRFCGEGDVIPV